MTGHVLRRSVASLVGLTLLLVGAASLLVVLLDAPVWVPGVLGVGLVGIQYLVNPRIIGWLVPASVIPHDGQAYVTEHPVGRIVAERCRQAGVPLVRLGIVDDGTPNAFTFGHHRGDARIYVTRGLLERLDERELDAVVAHEVGHIRNYDFVVMTVAAVVPMVLYLVYVMSRGQRDHGLAIAAAAYVGYLLSELVLLSLCRARELGADHWSCEATGDGDAFASALIKVAYGIGQVEAERRVAAEQLRERAKHKQPLPDDAGLGARLKRGLGLGTTEEAPATPNHRMQSMNAMGIFEPRQAEALVVAFGNQGDARRAMAAMRWDVFNPWGRTLELLQTHPLVPRRILALADSGLPGAPRQVDVRAELGEVDPAVKAQLRAAWLRELLVGYVPWVLLVAMAGFGYLTDSLLSAGIGMTVAGAALVAKQGLRYPGEHPPARVGDLLHRLDASPVQGIGVELQGRLIGRGTPGYVLSPDVVLQDDTGFVPVIYRNPVPFAESLFGLFETETLVGEEVVVTGWYRRSPGPMVELNTLTRQSEQRVRSRMPAACMACSVGLTVVGVVVAAVGAFG